MTPSRLCCNMYIVYIYILFSTWTTTCEQKEREDDISFEEQLAAFDEVVKAGKVRGGRDASHDCRYSRFPY